MTFFAQHQLNIMLVLIGVCGSVVIFATFTNALERRRKMELIGVTLSSMLLLTADRFAYIYRGDVSTTGWWMVRICNFLVFFMTLSAEYAFNEYVIDLFEAQIKDHKVPKRLCMCRYLLIIGEVLVVVSQFTGLYYTFDETNHYQRAAGFYVSYAIPIFVLIIELSVIIQYYRGFTRESRVSILLFVTIPMLAAFAQIFTYGLSLTNMAMISVAVMLYTFGIKDSNDAIARARKLEIEYLQEEQRNIRNLFEQTAQALASAIDAKDKYTHGHSTRVAEYSRKIAELAGKDEKSCDEIYFAALLHDVGKIGISESIINKDGKLTDEEFAEIKKHPVIGHQILSRISQSPYLSIGAHYHHERYDGRGYPRGLKGNDIPEIARIIAVADAYDAMTSKRSYRDPIPQQKVREELVKGSGNQFDPVYAKFMLHLIDLDSEYQMKEKEEIKELSGKNELVCDGFASSISEGIIVTGNKTTINLRSRANADVPYEESIPSIILFDSLDARIYDTEYKQKEANYFEYGTIRFDGYHVCEGVRKIKADINDNKSVSASEAYTMNKKGIDYMIEAVRYRDHMLLKIVSMFRTIEMTIALPDATRYIYIGLTGEHCIINNVEIKKSEEEIDKDFIPRIAEEISYIDVPAGDIPNIQIEGWRMSATRGVPVKDGMKISFHTMSLPTARLVWHCPYVSIFYSDDREVKGPNYREFVLVRLDGENWESVEYADNKILVNMTDDFEGWDHWKKINKEGMDCEVTIHKKGNKIIVTTENAGIIVKSITQLKQHEDNVYVALTGDQVAITNIRFKGVDITQ